jgi:hypothetical protein
MRRIFLVLAVAALMAAMMLASAMPAFAAGGANNHNAYRACDHPGANNVWFC